jgi:hypothetical protein
MAQTAPGAVQPEVKRAMKSLTEYLTFNLPARMDFVNITSQVADCDGV